MKIDGVAPTNFFDLDKPNPNIKKGKSILNFNQEQTVTGKTILELEKDALSLLQKGILIIRSLARDKNISAENLKRIEDIADSCHNVPHYYQSQDYKNLEAEIRMMKQVINGTNGNDRVD